MSDLESENFDPRRRRLCPDGECVGLVGPDGRCRVCGQIDTQAPAGLGAEAFAGGCASEDEPHEGAYAEGPDSGHHTGEHNEFEPQGAASDFDPARKLCPDGDCVGVLGADGRCKVCGQSAGASSPSSSSPSPAG